MPILLYALLVSPSITSPVDPVFCVPMCVLPARIIPLVFPAFRTTISMAVPVSLAILLSAIASRAHLMLTALPASWATAWTPPTLHVLAALGPVPSAISPNVQTVQQDTTS